ncbi:S8 family serine peptidase [Leptobacterium flavescens]|uniref:S8 family serine peptidase n=1 Tax=Leptobacterium flavescens TaxID=472055 RepID=A0A6P0UHX7_9FLAO|nr:S8 family serine peptidase [Leptobacterium flavescens]NER12951.1 S8 family serine peptidase [Leptobacterium flavescens]
MPEICKKIIGLILLILIFSCNRTKHFPIPSSISDTISKKIPLSEGEMENWLHKDIINDTIPGTSLERAYNELLKGRKGQKVIVAIIDTEIDINHKDLDGQIWINEDEIANNGIDDDENGYIDDLNGWNFLGGLDNNIIYLHYESVRILKKYQRVFEGKSIQDISKDSVDLFKLYLKAKDKYDSQLNNAREEQDYGNFLAEGFKKSKETLKRFFPKEDYTLTQLDSLYEIYKNEEELSKWIYFMQDYFRYDLSEKWIYDFKRNADMVIEKSLNLDYNEHISSQANENSVEDTDYGNNNISGNMEVFYHGTQVAGIITAKGENSLTTNGVFNNIELMDLAVVANHGNERDKDIALAIKYAVDNGAKIINMSFGKDLSSDKEWVHEAFKYAEKNDVLIISSAGNKSYNLNLMNDYYPNDNVENKEEISNNFILVGASSSNLNENLVASFSNYGKYDVDIFAPGQEIKTLLPNNGYRKDSGTSLSSGIVSGIAALIRSHYPNLSASEVKQILMRSGIEYDMIINVPGSGEKKQKLHFKELSKSGKIINAYNAFLMAKELSKSSFAQ